MVLRCLLWTNELLGIKAWAIIPRTVARTKFERYPLSIDMENIPVTCHLWVLLSCAGAFSFSRCPVLFTISFSSFKTYGNK